MNTNSTKNIVNFETESIKHHQQLQVNKMYPLQLDQQIQLNLQTQIIIKTQITFNIKLQKNKILHTNLLQTTPSTLSKIYQINQSQDTPLKRTHSPSTPNN